MPHPTPPASSPAPPALPVAYTSAMVAPAQGAVSPSAAKPALVLADWQRAGLPLRLVDVTPATRAELALAHDRAYVDAVLDGARANGFGTRCPAVAASLPYTTGALLSAARVALRERTAVCAPVSGFHHAGWAHGAGFCTFNGLVVTARAVLEGGLARRVAILDCDMHEGDGTDAILDHLGRPAAIRHATAGARFGARADVPAFFAWLAAELAALAEVDVVLYQAGADPHVDDPLGGWLTTAELRRRDALVLGTLARAGVPVVWDLAGGYQRDAAGTIAPVLAIHRHTAEAHLTALAEGGAGVRARPAPGRAGG